MHHVQYTVTGAGSQIEHLHTGVCCGIAQGGHMAHGQVGDVNIIPHASAVGRGIVVAEHVQIGQRAHCHTGDIRHEVIGNIPGTFADQAAFVSAHGIEVAQQHRGEVGVCRRIIPDDLLNEQLRPAVGVGTRPGRSGLAKGEGGMLAVHRGGGAEDQPADAMGIHQSQQRQRAVQIVAVVVQGQTYRLAHSL